MLKVFYVYRPCGFAVISARTKQEAINKLTLHEKNKTGPRVSLGITINDVIEVPTGRRDDDVHFYICDQ